MFQQQKIMNMGELLQNVGHHWRQPLSIISTIASSIKLSYDLDSLDTKNLIRDMNSILNTTQKLSQTITYFNNNLKYDEKLVPIFIENIASQIESLSRSQLENDNISFFIKNNASSYKISICERRFISVLLSLINNSHEALLKRKISNKEIMLTIDHDNTHITFELIDNAGGIPEEILNRIFEPYFTTEHKSFNKGLSLYLGHEIITNIFNGTIMATNKNDGALFLIKLPIYKD